MINPRSSGFVTILVFHKALARRACVRVASYLMDAASKIERYEELLNEQLKVELQQVHDERDAVYDKLAQW